MDYDTFITRIQTEVSYFKNTYEKAVLKSTPGKDGKIFVRFKGVPEFEAKQGSGVVAEAILEHALITKEEYDNF